jgi:hypothetical protein
MCDETTKQNMDAILGKKIFEQALASRNLECIKFAIASLESKPEVAEQLVLEIKILKVILSDKESMERRAA